MDSKELSVNQLNENWQKLYESMINDKLSWRYKDDLSELTTLTESTYALVVKEGAKEYYGVPFPDRQPNFKCTMFYHYSDAKDVKAAELWNHYFPRFAEELEYLYFILSDKSRVNVNEIEDLNDLFKNLTHFDSGIPNVISPLRLNQALLKLYPKKQRQNGNYYLQIEVLKNKLRRTRSRLIFDSKHWYYEKKVAFDLSIAKLEDSLRTLEGLSTDFLNDLDKISTKSLTKKSLPKWRESKESLKQVFFNFLIDNGLIDKASSFESFDSIFSGLPTISFQKEPIVWADNFGEGNTNKGTASLYTFIKFLIDNHIIDINVTTIEFNNLNTCFLKHDGRKIDRIRKQSTAKYKHEELLDAMTKVLDDNPTV